MTVSWPLVALGGDFGDLIIIVFLIGSTLLGGITKWLTKKKEEKKRSQASLEGDDIVDATLVEAGEDDSRPTPIPVAKPAHPPVRPAVPAPPPLAKRAHSPRAPVRARPRSPGVGTTEPMSPPVPPFAQIAVELRERARRSVAVPAAPDMLQPRRGSTTEAAPTRPALPPRQPSTPEVAHDTRYLVRPTEHRPETEAADAPWTLPRARRAKVTKLRTSTVADLRHAILMAEILGPPIALREVPGRGLLV